MRRERARERHNRKLPYICVLRVCREPNLRRAVPCSVTRFGPVFVMVTLVTLKCAPGGLRKEHIFIRSSAKERGLEWVQ